MNPRQRLFKKVKSMAILGTTGSIAFGGIGVWTGNERFFEEFVSPLLIHVDPEISHRAAVVVTKFHLQRSFQLQDPSNLRTKIGPLELPNPIGIAAGFDKNAECISGLKRTGYGWVEVGSVTPHPQSGNSKPRVFRLPEDSAVINRYGFNNDGHDVVYKRVNQFKIQHPNYVVGVNLGANKDSPNRISDYCKGVEKFSDTADYFVINISSPNTPNLRDLQKSESLPELLRQVIQTRDAQSRCVPIFLKVAPDITDIEIKSICKTITMKGTKVDGLIVSNTTVQRDSLVSKKELGNEAGGLSGKPLERVSTILVAKFFVELQGIVPIIGVGGVWDAKDVLAKLQAGASAVQIYTVVAYRGLGVVNSIKTELLDLLEKNSFTTITEAVGSRHAQTQATSKSVKTPATSKKIAVGST